MKNKIPQLGKTINQIQNPNNYKILKQSTINMFMKSNSIDKRIKALCNKKHVDSLHDELLTDHHDGKIIKQYIKQVKNFVKDNKITPAQYTQDVKTRYKNIHYLKKRHQIQTNPKVQHAKVSQKVLNKKYGYIFKPQFKKFSPQLNNALEQRNDLLITHIAEIAEKKENYYIKVMDDESPESSNNQEAENGESVMPTKWFPNMDEAKEYAKGINSNYDNVYNTQVNFKKHHPYDPTAKSSKDLKKERQNKQAFNKSMKQTYKNTEKISKKLNKKFDHPSKRYKHTIKKYNKQIRNELVKAGYLKPTEKGQKILKNVVGLKHHVYDKKHQMIRHQPKVSKEHKQNRTKQLTKQQETRYEKTQGRQM